MASKCFLAGLLVACWCAVALADTGIPMDCCLEVANKEVKKHAFANYHRQVSGQGCFIDAMILVTRHGKTICVPMDSPWVVAVMQHVDGVRRHCKRKNYKGKRCFGVRP